MRSVRAADPRQARGRYSHGSSRGRGQFGVAFIAALCAGPWPGAASSLTLLNRDSSGDLVTRAAGVGYVREFAGPTAASWRPGTTRGRHAQEGLLSATLSKLNSLATSSMTDAEASRVLIGAPWGKHVFEDPILQRAVSMKCLEAARRHRQQMAEAV
jgi:hypothetical protein